MVNTLWIMALEPIESRYTWYWLDFLPTKIKEYITKNNITYNVKNIVGKQKQISSTAGAFLNFSQTNIWKNEQINIIAEKFSNNEIIPGDKFLFTDAWHPGIIQIKYMSELLDIPAEIHSIWHAGSYDPQDFLGRKIVDKKWSNYAENSFFNASTKNYFATDFHVDLFKNKCLLDENDEKIVRCGLPFDYISDITNKYDCSKKENLILFPHRVAPEKQPEIFIDIVDSLKQYDISGIICQDKNLSKHEYYTLLSKSKLVFSANLQETLGISCYEGLLMDSVPFVPDRLSYSEMYNDDFKYPSEWTENEQSYFIHKDKLLKKIFDFVYLHKVYKEPMKKQKDSLTDSFFSCHKLLSTIFKGKK